MQEKLFVAVNNSGLVVNNEPRIDMEKELTAKTQRRKGAKKTS